VKHQERLLEFLLFEMQSGRVQRVRQASGRLAQLDGGRRQGLGLLADEPGLRDSSEIAIENGHELREVQPVAQPERLVEPSAVSVEQRPQKSGHLAGLAGHLRPPGHPPPVALQQVQVVVEVVALEEIGHDLPGHFEVDAARRQLGPQPQWKEP
jgi:hypothetical protein